MFRPFQPKASRPDPSARTALPALPRSERRPVRAVGKADRCRKRLSARAVCPSVRSSSFEILRTLNVHGRNFDPRTVLPPGREIADHPRISTLSVGVLGVAGLAAGEPVLALHAQVWPGTDADLMAHQHRRLAAWARRMGLEEGSGGALELGIVTALASGWSGLIGLPLAGLVARAWNGTCDGAAAARTDARWTLRHVATPVTASSMRIHMPASKIGATR